VTKRRNTFAESQEADQSARQQLIKDYLAYLASTRVKTEFVTDLAKLVAGHLTEVQGEPCSPSTLLRNMRYKGLLLSYMASRQPGGLKNATPGAQQMSVAGEVVVFNAQLETANVKRELDRLKIYTTDLEQQLAEVSSTKAPAIGHGKESEQARLGDMELSFVRTCQTLLALLSHLSVVVTVDVANRRILDASRRRNNVIVDADVAGPFFQWLSQQPDLGH
jgi:hypothetical protein